MALKDQKEVLIAWINGETVQYKQANGWVDCNAFFETDKIYLDDDCTYRIKPKEIVTTTRITFKPDLGGLHSTYSNQNIDNLRLTWSEDGKTLFKAEVI